MAATLVSSSVTPGQFSKLPVFLKSTDTDPFAAWFVLTEDAIPDGKRVV